MALIPERHDSQVSNAMDDNKDKSKICRLWDKCLIGISYLNYFIFLQPFFVSSAQSSDDGCNGLRDSVCYSNHKADPLQQARSKVNVSDRNII